MATPTLGGVPTTLDDAESTTGWTKLTTLDTDLVKEGSNSVSGILRNDLATGYYDIIADGGSAQNMTGRHVRVWINFSTVAFLDTEANGGMEFFMYDGTNTAYWVAFGSDTYAGGWKNYVLDCDSSPDSGSFDKTSVRRWGFRFNRTGAPANKINTWVDYLRWGDGYYVTGGTSGDEIDFAGIQSQDESNGYGIVEIFEGIYFGYGAITIGNGATTTWFEMLGDVLVFTDSPVATGLYKLVGTGSGARVNIQDAVLRAAGTTASTRFIIDMDDTDLVSCSINGSFINRAGESRFKSGQDISNNTFADCGQILAAGADLTGTVIKDYEGTADTSALIWTPATDPDGLLDDMSFTKGTAATHAIEFGTGSPLTMTMRNLTTSGYNASNGQTDSTFHVKRTSGTVTINVVGGSGNVSYKTDGATVLVVSTVDVDVHVEDSAGAAIENAQVYIQRAVPTTHTAGAGNTAGSATLVVTAAIDADQPQTGYVQVRDVSLNAVQGYRYDSWSTSTFNLLSEVTGSTTSETPNGTDLISTSTNFLTADVEEGDTIRNTTDGSWAVVDEIVDADNITTTPLQGGTDNLWNTSDVFSLHRLATTLVSGTDTVDTPLVNEQTDTSGDIVTLGYDKTQAPTDIVVRVRSNQGTTKYIPFKTSGTISATSGFSLNVILVEDTQAT